MLEEPLLQQWESLITLIEEYETTKGFVLQIEYSVIAI